MPAKVLGMPAFPHLRENNVRKGFLEDAQLHALVADGELWFRALVECGRTYGWRVSELLSLKVNQVDLEQQVIRLDPGTTKNSDGREVFMTDAVRLLLAACVHGKTPRLPGLYSKKRNASPRLSGYVGSSLCQSRCGTNCVRRLLKANGLRKDLRALQRPAIALQGSHLPRYASDVSPKSAKGWNPRVNHHEDWRMAHTKRF